MAEMKGRKKKPMALTAPGEVNVIYVQLTKSLSMSSNTTRLLPYLVLGGQESSADMSTLELLGITHILNVSKDCKSWFDDGKISYCRVPIEDEPAADAAAFFGVANEYLTEVRNIHLRGDRAAAMVHCKTGMSRSSTMVLCHMLLTEGMLEYIADFTDRRSLMAETDLLHRLPHRSGKHITLRDALAYIRERRPRASPNAGFMQQLVELEAQLHHGTVSIDLEKYKRDRFGDVRTFCIGEIDPVTGYTGSSAASINDDIFLLSGGKDLVDNGDGNAATSTSPIPVAKPAEADFGSCSNVEQPLRTSKRAPVGAFGFGHADDASPGDIAETSPQKSVDREPAAFDDGIPEDVVACHDALSGAVRRRSAVGDLPEVHPPARISRRSNAAAVPSALLEPPVGADTSPLEVQSGIVKKRRSSAVSFLDGQNSTAAAAVAAARADIAQRSFGEADPASTSRGILQLQAGALHEPKDVVASSTLPTTELEGINSLQLGSEPRPPKPTGLPVLSTAAGSPSISPVAASASWNARGKDAGTEGVSTLSVHGYSIFAVPQPAPLQGTSVSPAASNFKPTNNRA